MGWIGVYDLFCRISRIMVTGVPKLVSRFQMQLLCPGFILHNANAANDPGPKKVIWCSG